MTLTRYTMPRSFNITCDYEFYIFLKSSLPVGYRIESVPSAAYYSEWMFTYLLYKGNVLLRKFEGDFRKLEKGMLVREALAVLENAEEGN
jgi:hypothetical protein